LVFGIKKTERYAKLLNLPVAIIHKTRISGAEVNVRRIMGDVRDKHVLVVDDIISTGGTIEKRSRLCSKRAAYLPG